MKTLNLHTTTDVTLVCTKVNRTTKQASRYISMYNNTTKGDSIFKAYKKPSGYKVEAFNEIVREMNQVKGYGIRITGAGCDVFSCAYRVKDGSGVEWLIYHTPDNRFCVEYSVPEWMENNRR